MPEASFRVELIGGVPVVATPEEIDISNVVELRTALLRAPAQERGMLVVDMSGTQFCDTSGIHVLLRAHERARADGGELLLVLPAGTVLRVFTITGIDRVIPNFSSLDEALSQAGAPLAKPFNYSDKLAVASLVRGGVEAAVEGG